MEKSNTVDMFGLLFKYMKLVSDRDELGRTQIDTHSRDSFTAEEWHILCMCDDKI